MSFKTYCSIFIHIFPIHSIFFIQMRFHHSLCMCLLIILNDPPQFIHTVFLCTFWLFHPGFFLSYPKILIKIHGWIAYGVWNSLVKCCKMPPFVFHRKIPTYWFATKWMKAFLGEQFKQSEFLDMTPKTPCTHCSLVYHCLYPFLDSGVWLGWSTLPFCPVTGCAFLSLQRVHAQSPRSHRRCGLWTDGVRCW